HQLQKLAVERLQGLIIDLTQHHPPIIHYSHQGHHHCYLYLYLYNLLAAELRFLRLTPPLRKRLLLTAPRPGCKVGESSAARQPGPTTARSVDCSFVDPMETRFQDTERRMMTALEMVNMRVNYQVDVRSRESSEFYSRHHDTQEDRATVRAEIEVLRRERLSYEQESIQIHEALARFEAYSMTLETRVVVLETQARRHEWQRQTADDFAVQHIMLVMSADSAVTYTSVHSEARSWCISSKDPYEEVARQLLEQAPRSPEYVPDPIELEDHVPLHIPEHPEDEAYILEVASAPTPPLPPSFLSLRIRPLHTRAAMAQMRAAVPSTYHSLLPSGTPPLLPISLPVPSTSSRAEIPEADTPPRKRLLLTAPRPGYEVGESSAAVRQPGPTTALLETQARQHEWQRQTADDFVVQHIMRTQALEAEARIDTLEDTVVLILSCVIDLKSNTPRISFFHCDPFWGCYRLAPRSPEYVPDPIELEDHVPLHIPEHPEDEAYILKVASAPTPPLPQSFLSLQLRFHRADTLPRKRLLLTAPRHGCEEDRAAVRAEIEPKRTTRSTQVPPVTPAPTATTTTITEAQLQTLINQGFAAAMAEAEASRVRNGYGSNGSGPRLAQKMMTDKYCSRGEIKKLETHIWELKTKGTDVIGYSRRFQELALMCDRMFLEESDRVEKYIGGLPDTIHDIIKATRPKTMQGAIEFAIELMDRKICTFAERQTENKRKKDDNNNQAQQQPLKKQGVAIAYTVGPGERKEYAGTLPLCNKCKFHHNGQCTVKCVNCKRVGHMTRDCRSPVATNNHRNPTCYQCRNQGHYKSDLPELKNQGHVNQAI
nr:hypothetical protein [Tanacetum cinerariifolium]